MALIAPTLPLTIPLRCLRVGLPVLLLIGGMRVPPLFAALLNDLSVDRIGTDLLVVIVALTVLLAGGLATDGLLGMKARRLEESLAITATTIIHQLGSGSECERAHSVQKPSSNRSQRQKIRRVIDIEFLPHVETLVEFLPRPRGWGAAHQTGRIAALLDRRQQPANETLIP
ncbi:MAG TPA: hypothetical protein VF749_21405 [Candidatus Acidoferrum sp.]